jgi:hypothetical protein
MFRLGAGLFLVALCGAELKDPTRAAIVRHAKKWTDRHQGSSVLMTETKTATAAPTPTEQIDGTTYYWNVGNWSDCSADCGPGLAQRPVECVNGDTGKIEDDSVCQNDPTVAARPSETQDCQGPCITCTDRSDLFQSIGLAKPPLNPVRSRTTQVCKVNDPKYSCCDRTVENSMVTQVVAIQKGFRKVPETAIDQKGVVVDFIANSTKEFQERLDETNAQLATLNELLTQPSNLKGDKKQLRALNVVRDVLSQRVIDLQNAISNSSAIVDAINQQLGVLSADVSLNMSSDASSFGLGNTTNSSLAVGKKAELADCVDATVSLFASLGCAACNPSFVKDNVDSKSGIFSSINVSTTMCTSLYKQCSPTVRDSRRFLRQALQIMRSIHSSLSRTAARLQPALLALWSEIAFDWLPGASHPMSSDPFYAGQNTFVPDISSLDCIKTTSVYVLPPATTVDDFCSNFFDSWNYQYTISNLIKDVKVGVQAMGALQKCDKCVHLIASKMGEILANGKGGLDVTLKLSKEALADAGCAGLSSTPVVHAADTIKQKLLSGQLNLFAIKEGDSVFTRGERSNLAHKSMRVISMILSASFLKSKDALDSNDALVAALDSNSTFIHKLEYTDSGIDPTAWANVSWDVVANANKNPPPSIWQARESSEVGIIATDFNCTSHLSCNPESGDAPYWFCANSKVCNGTLPCSDDERQLLVAHPRCVKGLCVSGATAVDGKCPDISICPVTSSGQFDHFYFSRFKSIAPIPPPNSDLIQQEGALMAGAITQAVKYSAGVCDCAFTQTTDEKGLVSLKIGDQCKYAQCLAYAIANEAQPNCQAGLAQKCASLKAACPSVDCDKIGAQWTPPTCETSITNSAPLVAASETKSVDIGLGAATAVLLALVAVLVF